MRLKSLKIYKKINGETVRNVNFNPKGLSLICDDESDEHNYHGSSIGKTAFVKCIDICLGASSIKSIYSNSSTGENEELMDYINDNQISLQLIVNSNNGVEYVLERHLYDKLEFINGEVFNNYKDYNKKLKDIFFPGAPKDLSFRSIMPKFIRLDSDNVIKYIKSYGRKEDYYYAYNYFLNFYIDEEENNLLIESNNLKNRNKIIEKEYKIRSVEELDDYIDKKRIILSQKRSDIINNDYLTQYSGQDERNLDLIYELDHLTDKLYAKELRAKNLRVNIDNEDKKLLEIDNDVLILLYEDAKGIFKDTLKDYKDFVDFHNEMCTLRKKGYIEELKQLMSDIIVLNQELKDLRELFNKQFVEYKTNVNESSNSLYEEYYNNKIKFDLLVKEKAEYENNKSRLDKINVLLADIASKKKSNENNKELFNNIFKEKCAKLLNETADISYCEQVNNIPLTIKGLGGKLGTGDNKTLICAFDFAFYAYFIDKSLNRPSFIIHDKMENVSLENLKLIFDEVRKMGIQYILPILHDRIEQLDISKEEIVLNLSKTDKLFRCK